MINNLPRIATWCASIMIIAFLCAPILLIMLYAFNTSNVQIWPIHAVSVRWFVLTLQDQEVRGCFLLSAEVAVMATVLALLIGTSAALAANRLAPAGSQIVTFTMILPIALPGILTGMALNSYFALLGQQLSVVSIVIGHATFCSVIIYNNVLARLRRIPRSLAEAGADLGAGALYGFCRVTLPLLTGALRAGALLSFALSFDEVIVTTFTAGTQTTLPLWVFGAIRLGQKLPEVNVVVFGVLALTLPLILLAQRVPDHRD